MLGGIDPAQIAQMQEVSRFIKCIIRVNYKEKTVLLSFSSEELAAIELIPQLLDQFSGGLATQLSSFFAIDGEIIESGKEG